jgi:hypothetical protein
MSSQLKLPKPSSQPSYCHALTIATLSWQEFSNNSFGSFKKFKIVLPDLFSKLLNVLTLPHSWKNCIGYLCLKELITRLLPCATMLSQILPHLTCLICFIVTFHLVYCVHRLTHALLESRNERISSKGSAPSPISALSLGIDSLTQHVMLQHTPSSKLVSKPHYSAQPSIQTHNFCSVFPPPLFPVDCKCAHVRALVCVCMCVCVSVWEVHEMVVFVDMYGLILLCINAFA